MTRRARFARFSGVGLGGVVVQLATLAALTSGAGAHYSVATPLAVLAAITHNFYWHCRWTWRDRPARRSVPAAFFAFATANGAVSLVGNMLLMSILVGRFGLPELPANIIAIAACSAINFTLADRVVFAGRTPARPARRQRRQPPLRRTSLPATEP
jgi:putative flippase GtrA